MPSGAGAGFWGALGLVGRKNSIGVARQPVDTHSVALPPQIIDMLDFIMFFEPVVCELHIKPLLATDTNYDGRISIGHCQKAL